MADLIASARSIAAISESQHVTVGMPYKALTPATITAMTGLAQGGALQVAPSVTNALSGMSAKAADLAVSNPALAASLTSAASSLSSLKDKLLPPGNPGLGIPPNPLAFAQKLTQVQAHINDTLELEAATKYIQGASFADFGTGVKDMGSMVTQGLDTVMGSLPAAGEAFSAMGPMYDLKDMANFGTSAGLINKLSSVKLANASGINEALTKAGVDTTRLSDPVYAAANDRVLAGIKDPAVIKTVTDQLGVNPVGSIDSLKDLTDISKVADPAKVAGLSTSLKGMADKLSDMGGKFKNSDAAKNLMNSLDSVSVPKLNSFAPSLSELVDNCAPTLDGLTGKSVLGKVPNIKDMLGAAAGGPQIDEMNAALASGSESAIAAAVAKVNSMVSTSQSLLSTAGIDVDATPPSVSLGSAMGFATSLHKLGANVTGSGVVDALKGMATNDAYGEAIKASLAEGKNKALLAANGIPPLDFSGQNPFAGLPSAGSDNSLGSATQLLGG